MGPWGWEEPTAARPVGARQKAGPAARTRRGMLAGGVTVGSVLAGACSGSGTGVTPRVPGGQVQISFLTDWASGPRGQVIQEAAKLWQQKYPSITLNLRIAADGSSGPVQVQMAADLAAGTTADVALYSSKAVAAQRGAFIDVMPYVKRDKVDLKEFLTVEPELQDQGGLYGLPFQYVMSIWLVNKDVLRQNGIRLPDDKWTWDDLLAAARRLTVPGQMWGIEDNRGLDDWLDGWLPSNGGAYISDDHKHTLLNTPPAIEAVRWIADRYARDKVIIQAADRAALGVSGAAFPNAKVGFAHYNSSIIGAAATTTGFDQIDWDVMWTPESPRTGKGLAHVGDQPHVMPKRPSQTPAQTDAAWLFLTFMSGPEVQALIAEGRGSLPVYKKVIRGDRYLRTPPASMAIIAKLADTPVFSVGWFPGYDEWWSVVRPLLLSAMRGEVAVDDALRQASEQGDAVLQQVSKSR